MAKGLLMLAPDDDGSDEKPKGDSKPSGSMSATKALLKAIKADDAKAADEALKLHYELCNSESDEDY